MTSIRQCLLLATLFAPNILAQQSEAPRTTAERSSYEQTSRAADVEAFVDACTKLSHGDRLEVHVAGKTSEGRGMLLVKVRGPNTDDSTIPPPRLRALVIGNIHAGEVEGKEALQELIREFAEGKHAELLAHAELWLVPIYNVDGNEAVKVGNRRGQNGPDAVGLRPNAQGLDLNRDFVKLDAPETRILMEQFREFDPHVFMDLHTTNGSHHGYHLTYSPSLNPNIDPEIDRYGRQLLADARVDMRKRGFETFDYGNFSTRDWDGGGAPSSKGKGWFTYDHRARYGTNYFALRNRISVLSEAYSYADFKTRIAATRAFVLSVLGKAVEQREEVIALTYRADQRLKNGEPTWHGSETWFAEPEMLPVLVGKVERQKRDGLPTRTVRLDESEAETMRVVRRFRSAKQRRLPRAWAIYAPSRDVMQRLQWHGIQHYTVKKGEARQAQHFAVTKKRKPKRPFQGHQELVLEGNWLAAGNTELPAGTVVIDARQPLARLAATLLEPESEDSLSSWNFFEDDTGDHYPVLRLLD